MWKSFAGDYDERFMSHPPPPMPVIPVAYRQAPLPPPGVSRPGGLTFIGVMGIILSVIGLGVSFATLIFSIATTVAAQAQATALAANAQSYPLTASGAQVSPDGFDAMQSQAVVNGLQLARPMTAQEANQVRSLAQNHGKKLFSFNAASISATRVAANVSESGQVLNSSGKLENYYVLGEGRIDVGEGRALFRATDGEVYRSNEVAVNRALDEDQINQVVTEINLAIDTPLNATQESKLRTMLRDPSQLVVTADEVGAIQAGRMQPDTVWFVTDSAQVRMDKSGNTVLMSSMAPVPGTNPFSGKKISLKWGRAMQGEALVSGAMAVFLMVGSIILLRGRPVGRKLLIIYGLAGIPLAIVGGLAVGFAAGEWVNAFNTPTNPVSMNVAYIASILFGGFQIIWPLIVLLAMTRKSVKDHFKGVI